MGGDSDTRSQTQEIVPNECTACTAGLFICTHNLNTLRLCTLVLQSILDLLAIKPRPGEMVIGDSNAVLQYCHPYTTVLAYSYAERI